MQERIQNFVESKQFEKFIVAVITINALTIGLETFPQFDASVLNLLAMADSAFLAIFVAELLIKFFVYRSKFFRDPWRVFDFIVVAIALVPASGPFSILRSLRILRALRMISVVPALRKVVNGLLVAIPGLGAVSVVMLLIFYIGAVIATKFFGNAFPEWFGNIWASSYSLFQIMTLESWSMGIVRPVMEQFPYAWAFFLPFILLTTFTMLNLFIAVIVNAMQAETDAAAAMRAEQSHDERVEMMKDLKRIRELLEKNQPATAPRKDFSPQQL